MKKYLIIIIILVFILGLSIGMNLNQSGRCAISSYQYQSEQYAISAYQHELEKQVKRLQEDEICEYDAGWNNALWNVLNILEYK